MSPARPHVSAAIFPSLSADLTNLRSGPVQRLAEGVADDAPDVILEGGAVLKDTGPQAVADAVHPSAVADGDIFFIISVGGQGDNELC